MLVYPDSVRANFEYGVAEYVICRLLCMSVGVYSWSFQPIEENTHPLLSLSVKSEQSFVLERHIQQN